MPSQIGFNECLSVAGGKINFQKTQIQLRDGKRISAFVFREYSTTKGWAKINASREYVIVLALMSLSEKKRFNLANIGDNISRRFNEVWIAKKEVNIEKYYRKGKFSNQLEAVDSGVCERFQLLWEAFQRLSFSDKKIFKAALFAYYGAVMPHIDHSTLSVIGYTAALAALSHEKRKKTTREQTCYSCGATESKEELISEVQAIIDVIFSVCRIEGSEMEEVSRLVKRVYREQRSAFVHAAEMRHEEYNREISLPPQVPTNDAPVRPMLRYQIDLLDYANITRVTLIEWLGQKAEMELNHQILNIGDSLTVQRCIAMASIFCSSSFEARLAL